MIDPKDDSLVDDEGGASPIYGGSIIDLSCRNKGDIDEDAPLGRADRKRMRSVNVAVSLPGLPDIPNILVYVQTNRKCLLCWDRVDVLGGDQQCYPIKGSHNVPFADMPQLLSSYFARRLEESSKRLSASEVEDKESEELT